MRQEPLLGHSLGIAQVALHTTHNLLTHSDNLTEKHNAKVTFGKLRDKLSEQRIVASAAKRQLDVGGAVSRRDAATGIYRYAKLCTKSRKGASLQGVTPIHGGKRREAFAKELGDIRREHARGQALANKRVKRLCHHSLCSTQLYRDIALQQGISPHKAQLRKTQATGSATLIICAKHRIASTTQLGMVVAKELDSLTKRDGTLRRELSKRAEQSQQHKD